jgi:hypothetical protein
MPRKVNRAFNASGPYRPPSRNRTERIQARHEQLAKTTEALVDLDPEESELRASIEAARRGSGG